MTEKRFEAVVDGFIDHKTGRGLTQWFEISRILNELAEENDQLRSEISMKDDLIQQLRIKLNKDWYNEWKETIQQYSDVCEELVEVNKDYKRVEKDRDRLNDIVQYVWNVLLDVDRDKLCFEERRFFDELCNELGFDLSRIRMIEIDTSIDSADDK